MEKIDFTNLPIKNKAYNGANGNKIAVLNNGNQYMLKFSSASKMDKHMKCINSCISEYLGSHIFNMLGITAQETILGTYTKDNKERIVVACKDFTSIGVEFQNFASLKNTIIDSEQNGYGTELSDIIDTIDKQRAMNSTKLKEHFWDMFIVDAFIGNSNRNNENWGFLYDNFTDEIDIAPVFACGSCLFSQTDDEGIQSVIDNQEQRDARVFNIPLSSIRENDKKINYYDFIYSLKNDDCSEALKRIVPRIDLNKINELIDKTPYISEQQRLFYKIMLRERKEKILDKSLYRLKTKERSNFER